MSTSGKSGSPSKLVQLRHVLAAALASLTIIAASHAQAAEKVVFGWLPATDALPFFVAMQEKAFEAQGIEVVSQRFTSPTTLVDAFLSNQAEVGPFGTAPGIALVAESQNPGSLKLFGLSGGEEGTPYVNSSLLVTKGSPIRTLPELKGKKLGVIPGIQWRTNAKYILRANGLEPDKDVLLVELGFPVQIPALVAGTVDALIAIEPMGSMAIASGQVESIITNIGAKYVANPWYGGCAVMTTKFIKERPEVARKVMLVLRNVTKEIETNFDRYRPLLAKYVGVPEAALPAVKPLKFRNDEQVNDRDFHAVQTVLDMLYHEKVLATPIDIHQKFVRLADIKEK